MTDAKITIYPKESLVALVGNPNCGKTSLFNLLTGGQQKVANYAGVTVERKEGKFYLQGGSFLRILDLPGVYSLYPRTPDERISCHVLMGNAEGEKRPDLVLCVLDATNLRRGLRLVLGIKRLGLPCVVVLNMMDLALHRGMQIDLDTLAVAIGLPVVATVGVHADGISKLKSLLNQKGLKQANDNITSAASTPNRFGVGGLESSQSPSIEVNIKQDNEVVREILLRLGLEQILPDQFSDRLDRVLLHPVLGQMILLGILFLMFQAVFSWAEWPMAMILRTSDWFGEQCLEFLPDHWIRSLIIHGVIAGVGGVLVFLPQILILFFFILVLEESGYLPRAAYLLDRLMSTVGLSGRSFIPLLSSFACAIPGIMATRTISNPRDRLVTILIAPLMTCSDRLPVYSLLIAAFIPAQKIGFGVQLQGVILFALYFGGIVSAMAIAWLLKKVMQQKGSFQPLMMELPSYHIPRIKNILLGLWQRMYIFLSRVGGMILLLTVTLWCLASYPVAPVGAPLSAIEYSFAGMLGRFLQVIFEPIGFNWQISLALVPGLAAREVVVSSLGTVYALSGTESDIAQALIPLLSQGWSLATALSLLMWFVFAPQCLSTLAAVRRETGGLMIPLVMLLYLFGLAYLASFLTYRLAVSWGLG